MQNGACVNQCKSEGSTCSTGECCDGLECKGGQAATPGSCDGDYLASHKKVDINGDDFSWEENVSYVVNLGSKGEYLIKEDLVTDEVLKERGCLLDSGIGAESCQNCPDTIYEVRAGNWYVVGYQNRVLDHEYYENHSNRDTCVLQGTSWTSVSKVGPAYNDERLSCSGLTESSCKTKTGCTWTPGKAAIANTCQKTSGRGGANLVWEYFEDDPLDSCGAQGGVYNRSCDYPSPKPAYPSTTPQKLGETTRTGTYPCSYRCCDYAIENNLCHDMTNRGVYGYRAVQK